MAGGAEQLQEIAEAGVAGHGHDVGAGQHHIVDAHLVQPEHVLEHGALKGRKGVLTRVGFGQGLLDVGAQGVARTHLEDVQQTIVPRLAWGRFGVRDWRGQGRAATSVVGHGSLGWIRRECRRSVVVRVWNAECAERGDLERLHGVGLSLAGLMVLSEKVKGAMDEEVGEMVLEGLRLLRTLAHERVIRKNHIAERPGQTRPERLLRGRKR